MKLFVACFAVFAVVAAVEVPTNEYLPPAEVAGFEQVAVEPQEAAVLADDGYRYKTVRRLKYRHRRDVSELPSNEYLPPVAVAEQQFVVEPQESAVLANDGYRYKAVRRLKYRHRRDVSELPSNEYLPPVAVAEQQVVVEPQESAALADDGYRYKTVRRLKYRHRRDVSELPSNEYLPPALNVPVAAAEQVVVEPQESAILGDDGYRYKAVRRLKYRHRRDVSELPSNEYLPPVALAEQQVVVEPQESVALADDGYRYKTVRRLKYRHRRDVSELPSNEYLPPALNVPVAVAEQVVVEPQESAVLGDDGYRYKTVRRLKYRHRRDVSELPSNEYLPPVAVADQQVVVEPQESAALADDGYRYKTVRRLKYRHRRDVSELPSNEYLPPVASAPVAVAEQQVVVVPQESAVLGDDGYRYKAVRRLKYRHRRDVSELPANEYLPPVVSVPVPVAEQQVFVEPQEAAVLAEDGYRYKTVRRLKYRHRRV
ncbi:uncharacterized protein LOC128862222 isoform X1 [Anastrepha ludens]|uniref:uncharacterized protein LOC128862222 isoform X1 n=1 Tax=Anastrepha ludens TaxID=28586 RepID=UPI0023B0ED7E|nr:uncharacterized protein LOC128862222 isoform X1 [Anastrepha ludens]